MTVGAKRRRRRRGAGCLRILKEQALEFCRETALHGYKYIGQSKRPKADRIVWAVAVFGSLSASLVLMKFAWDYYANHPTLTVIQSTHHGIWNYPFPAVTVCDNNRVSLSLARELVHKLKLPPNVTRGLMVQEMALLIELLEPGSYEGNITANLTRLQDILDLNGLSIPAVVKSVTRGCESLIESCTWQGRPANCTRIFRPSYTRDGLCCSFNHVAHGLDGRRMSGSPRRVTGCGYQTGITIQINLDPGDYHAILYGTAGIKVMFHEPHDYPDYNAPNKLIGMNVQTFVTVEPEETYSTEDVRSLSIPTRNCVFQNEVDLEVVLDDQRKLTGNRNEESNGEKKSNRRRRWKSYEAIRYSYLNCIAECRATTIGEQCGCVPYYYPQNGTRVCNLRDVPCLARNKPLYDTSWPGVDMDKELVPRKIPATGRRPCGCLPDCNFYRYYIESSRTNFDPSVYSNRLKYTREPSEGSSLENRSVVHVFFGDLVSVQFRRNVHYNWRNLFASFGGLLGLFAGFSLMSVFELVYFFVIRVLTTAWTNRD